MIVLPVAIMATRSRIPQRIEGDTAKFTSEKLLKGKLPKLGNLVV